MINKNKSKIMKIMYIALFTCILNATAITYITNCTGLQAMQNNLTETYILSNDIDCSNTINWNAGAGFLPIGVDLITPFSGCFDGQGSTISDLYINRIVEDYRGLFGIIESTDYIRNVTIVRANITGHKYIGILVGRTYLDNNITNVSIQGTVFADAWGIGGVAGRTSENTSIDLCSFNVTVRGTNSVGGVVGWSYGTISNFKGIVSIEGIGNVGGAAGYALFSGNISNGHVDGIVSGDDEVSGIAGDNNGDITNCFYVGNVSGNTNVGNIAGSHETGVITNCYFNNHTGNPNICTGSGGLGVGGSCTAIQNNEPYFYNVSNPPISSWDFPPWSDYYDLTDFPIFKWQEPTPTPTPTPTPPTPTPDVSESDFTGDMPSDYDVGRYEQQSGKDTGVMKGSIVYLIVIIMALVGLYIFFAAVLVISMETRETYKLVK